MTKYDPDLVFEFICKYKTAHDGNSPTIREIQDAMGIASSSHASNLLRGLEDRNLIRITDDKCRNIEVLGGSWAMPGSRSHLFGDSVLESTGTVGDLRQANQVGAFYVTSELFYQAEQARLGWMLGHFFIIQAKVVHHKTVEVIRYVAYSALFEPLPAWPEVYPLYEINISSTLRKVWAVRQEGIQSE